MKMDVIEEVRMLIQKDEEVVLSILVLVPGTMRKYFLKYGSNQSP